MSTSDLTLPKEGLREKGPSRGGTQSAWSVQVRCSGHMAPVILGEHAFDNQWRDLPFEIGAHGIPMGSRFDVHQQMGLMTYAAAQALRWWFLADLTVAGKEYRFETRLVRHEVTYSISTKPLGACQQTDHLQIIKADHGTEQQENPDAR
jgi:hypothetical protein